MGEEEERIKSNKSNNLGFHSWWHKGRPRQESWGTSLITYKMYFTYSPHCTRPPEQGRGHRGCSSTRFWLPPSSLQLSPTQTSNPTHWGWAFSGWTFRCSGGFALGWQVECWECWESLEETFLGRKWIQSGPCSTPEVAHPRWCCNTSPKDTDIQVLGEQIPEEGECQRPSTETSFLVPASYILRWQPFLWLVLRSSVPPSSTASLVVRVWLVSLEEAKYRTPHLRKMTEETSEERSDKRFNLYQHLTFDIWHMSLVTSIALILFERLRVTLVTSIASMDWVKIQKVIRYIACNSTPWHRELLSGLTNSDFPGYQYHTIQFGCRPQQSMVVGPTVGVYSAQFLQWRCNYIGKKSLCSRCPLPGPHHLNTPAIVGTTNADWHADSSIVKYFRLWICLNHHHPLFQLRRDGANLQHVHTCNVLVASIHKKPSWYLSRGGEDMYCHQIIMEGPFEKFHLFLWKGVLWFLSEFVAAKLGWSLQIEE